MLLESKKMQHVATTKKGKSTYEAQVKKSEEIYKNTFDLYMQSREEAKTAAKELAAEMQKAKDVENEIISEASQQLKHYDAGHVRSALEDSDDDDDDDADASPKAKRQSLLAHSHSTDDDKDDDSSDDSDDN